MRCIIIVIIGVIISIIINVAVVSIVYTAISAGFSSAIRLRCIGRRCILGAQVSARCPSGQQRQHQRHK